MLAICPTCSHALHPSEGIKLDKPNGVALFKGGAVKLPLRLLDMLEVLDSRRPNFTSYKVLRSLLYKRRVRPPGIPALRSYASVLRGEIEDSGFYIEMRPKVGLRLVEE